MSPQDSLLTSLSHFLLNSLSNVRLLMINKRTDSLIEVRIDRFVENLTVDNLIEGLLENLVESLIKSQEGSWLRAQGSRLWPRAQGSVSRIEIR